MIAVEREKYIVNSGTDQRRLAAIVSADVAGYSRLMGQDESRTSSR